MDFLSQKRLIKSVLKSVKIAGLVKKSGYFIIIFSLVALVILFNLFPQNFVFASLISFHGADSEDEYNLISESALDIDENGSLTEVAGNEGFYINTTFLLGQGSEDSFNQTDIPTIQGSSLVANDLFSEKDFKKANQRTAVVRYVVKAGDNPGLIADSFGLSVFTVLWANNLKDGDYIRPGQELVILPVNGVRHKVVKNETLLSIAKKYKADVGRIIEFNKIGDEGVINIGDFLIVPDGKMPVPTRAYVASIQTYAGQLRRLDDYFIFPTTGRITQGLHPHNAVDIANSSMPPIYAAAGGVVTIADALGWNGGYGQYVRIRHPNGVETLYAHMAEIYVSQGQFVSQGQVIGKMGRTGRVTGIHLHWEVRGAANPLAR